MFLFPSKSSLNSATPIYLRYVIWVIGIWQLSADLLGLIEDSGVMNIGDPFNAAKSHAIDGHFQAQAASVIAIAPMRFRVGEKLTTTINASMVLLATFDVVFADVT